MVSALILDAALWSLVLLLPIMSTVFSCIMILLNKFHLAFLHNMHGHHMHSHHTHTVRSALAFDGCRLPAHP